MSLVITKNTLVRLVSLGCYNKEYTSETHEFSLL